ncbi:NLI interacting factor-like phosphatase family protein [Tritrichomonas foetus]|uniref:Mitochondrial import inner membrane translocase subunit TIM50 n=1 Tax=Tritrichomonas foetus TaxID=1144522 RepID=A0A1J4KHT1_9EUKA|nr:NLI interacting factor-like phosphatase family protein [Tritrichomonas foetus]|eukprot:OHT10951.1 NLI interacting factor-like phosphatase family protein [Tritrichomonas foetus]
MSSNSKSRSKYGQSMSKSFSKSSFWRKSQKIDYIPPPPVGLKLKTLVLDLDETLIHSSDIPPHSKVDFFKSGDPEFYVYKRPGLDAFLQIVKGMFETFIFTYGEKRYADPLLDVVCPFIDSDHRLYRDQCQFNNGSVHKDLDLFQRAEENLILVDDNQNCAKFHPKNTIVIPRWMGTPFDRCLIDWLPPILEKCAMSHDVRDVITKILPQQRRASVYL